MTQPPEYGSVSAEEYAAIGFRSGLEVHQQLLTQKKLFCRCPAGAYSDHYDAEILRHMRPTLSELGEYDGTALMEFKTRKEIYYRLARDTVCTYEMDDAPPFGLNAEAVDIAIEIALLLNLQMIGELHIARKQYLDGSIPAGFQRTTILGVDGSLAYPGPLGGPVRHADRRIGIRQLGLEEDSCREISDVGHDRTYIADRLGTPLIEVVTEPQMITPQEVAEVGQHIRYLTRATGKVRRGVGRCRQDVNVSIAGGTRIEIKGVPRIPLIPRLVHYEAFRQKALLEIRDELKNRGVNASTWHSMSKEVTHLLRGVSFGPIADALERGMHVWAVRLPDFGGLLNRLTQPHTIFAQEFAERVRVIACLQGEPNLISSDSPHHAIAPTLWRRVLKKLSATASDVVVLVWGNHGDSATAVEEIRLRAVDAMAGVPSETRRGSADGTTAFERILPGPERMYPDTDLPPMCIDKNRVERIQTLLPELPPDRIKRYQDVGLSAELSTSLVRGGIADLFDELRTRVPAVQPSLLAYLLTCHLKHASRIGRCWTALGTDFLADLLRRSIDDDWPRERLLDVLDTALINGRPLTAGELSPAGLDPLTQTQLNEAVRDQLAKPDTQAKRKGPRTRSKTKLSREQIVHMGSIMRTLRGKAHAGDVAAELAKAVSRVGSAVE